MFPISRLLKAVHNAKDFFFVHVDAHHDEESSPEVEAIREALKPMVSLSLPLFLTRRHTLSLSLFSLSLSLSFSLIASLSLSLSLVASFARTHRNGVGCRVSGKR